MLSISPENLLLLKAVLLLILFVHFALLGVLFGSTTAALALDTFGRLDSRRHWRSLAAELVAKAIPARGTALLLPLTAALILAAAELAYPPFSLAGIYWLLILLPLVVSMAALLTCRQLLTGEKGGPLLVFGLGAAGLGLGLFSTLLLLFAVGLLLAPEQWPLLTVDPRLLFSWVASARFMEFTCLSFAATGVLLLTLGRVAAGADERAVVRAFSQRRAGAALALVFLLAWPLAALLGLYNLPTIALSTAVYALAATTLAVAAGLALKLLGVLLQPERDGRRSLCFLLLLLLALWLLGDHLARENSVNAATVAGLDVMVVSPLPSAPVESPAPVDVAATVDGKAVFDRLCTACHRFDARLVGPPLQSVLPKYRGNVEGLKDFIRNPSKQDPAYPAMPKLQLSEAELAAVASYLLERAAP